MADYVELCIATPTRHPGSQSSRVKAVVRSRFRAPTPNQPDDLPTQGERCRHFPKGLVEVSDHHRVYLAATSMIQTGDEVGINRSAARSDATSISSNSFLVRSRALPNMAIIWVSTR